MNNYVKNDYLNYNKNYNSKMTVVGYFTEIEQLKEKISDLESKLEQERQEFREAYMRMKASNTLFSSNYLESSHFYKEICFLREENARLIEEKECGQHSI